MQVDGRCAHIGVPQAVTHVEQGVTFEALRFPQAPEEVRGIGVPQHVRLDLEAHAAGQAAEDAGDGVLGVGLAPFGEKQLCELLTLGMVVGPFSASANCCCPNPRAPPIA